MTEILQPDRTSPANGAALPRGWQVLRSGWRTVALLLAFATGWLVFHAYRQPDFLIDFINLRLC